MNQLSHTRKVAFRSCRRKHHLMYDLGLRPLKEAIQLQVGSAMHTWLEEWFELQTLGPAQWICPVGIIVDPESNCVIPEIKVELAFEKIDRADRFEAARLRAMVLAYHLRWKLQDWRILRVEHSFRVPLVDPDTGEVSQDWERDGRLDVEIQIVAGVDSGCWVVEHKSHKGPLDPGDPYFTALRANPQVGDYFIGANLPIGIVYDVVCKPDIRPHKATPESKRKYTKGKKCKCSSGVIGAHDGGAVYACTVCKMTGWIEPPALYANQRERDETPGEFGLRCFELMLAEPHRYLHRVNVRRLEHELDEHMRDDWETAKDITAESKRDHHPRNPDACYSVNRPCDYFPVCWNGVEPIDGDLYRISKRPPMKPEMQTDEDV